jgi:predicted house-cleaning NTP pyrophosphatase (Maf/HAM1 superfamily)
MKQKRARRKHQYDQEHLHPMEIVQDVAQEKARHIMTSINTIRKQMILQEVCQDIIRIQNIIQDLLKYDSALSLTSD